VPLPYPIPIDVLVLAAYPPELSALSEAFGRHAIGDGTGTQEFAASIGSRTIVGEAVGVGLAAAAIGTTRCFQAWRPRAVVVVGTCGAYAGRGFAVGDVVRARRICLVSTAALEGRAGLPSIMATEWVADAELSSRFGALGLREADVATTLAVTTDDALAERIADRRTCDVEHLEAFSVASACAALEIPCAIVLGIANGVGAEGRKEWMANHRDAERLAAATVRRWLEIASETAT
jgi:nucleoside phosphorylase